MGMLVRSYSLVISCKISKHPVSEELDKANEFLLRVESAAASVGLHINEGKTKVMTLNMEDRSSDIQSRSGEAIENVDDFINNRLLDREHR